MKRTRYIGLMMMAASMVAATSCSDFDDYNEGPLDTSASANKTLWENIAANEQLTDFAALVKKAGFADELSRSNFYTVWAPLNGTYDATPLQQLDSVTLLKQFVENHIAKYNHRISGDVDERIMALNEKSYDFKGSGTYTFGNIAVAEPNLPSINGVMHTLNGEVAYHPNIYNYLFQLQGIDSVAGYFKKYEHSRLDTENSVLGPVVDGKQTYIDSVMVTTNDLFSRRELDAQLASEDSSYTMILPSDKAWNDLYSKIKSNYNYINTTIYQDVPNATSSSASGYKTQTVTVNAEYYSDSIAKRIIAQSLIYNNNQRLNRWLEKDGAYTDTLVSTGYTVITNPRELLSDTRDREEMSNGVVYQTDTLAFRPWEVYSPRVFCRSVGHVWPNSVSVEQVRVDYENIDQTKVDLQPGQTSLTYISAKASGTRVKPQLDIMLNNMRSTAYNVYCVIVPPNVDKTDTNTVVRPNQLDFEVSYCRANGTLMATQKLNSQPIENDPTRVDTVYVGRITFPVCYVGLGENVAPNIKIKTHFGVFSSAAMAKYTRDLNIGAIIMVPQEYDNYYGKKD